MKKGIILVSGSGKLAEGVIDKNRYGKEEPVEFIILSDNKEKLMDVYQLNLGCYIYYVPNFSAVEYLIRKNEIELIIFSGYLGKLPELLEEELSKRFPVYYYEENGNPLYEHGYRGEALVSATKYFKNI